METHLRALAAGYNILLMLREAISMITRAGLFLCKVALGIVAWFAAWTVIILTFHYGNWLIEYLIRRR